MLEGQTLNLLINAGVAGVFAAFALVMMRYFLKHLQEQADQWRSFLKQEGDQRQAIMSSSHEAMQQIVSNLATLTAQINLLASQNERIVRLIDRLRSDSQKTKPLKST